MTAPSKPITKGFTFIEAIAGIAFLTITSGLLVGAFFSFKALADRSDSASKASAALISTLDGFETLCQSIRPPFWISSKTLVDTEESQLKIKYWNGQPNETLTISWNTEGKIFFQVGTTEKSFLGLLKSAKIIPLKTGDLIKGIELSFIWNSKLRTYEFPFGARVL